MTVIICNSKTTAIRIIILCLSILGVLRAYAQTSTPDYLIATDGTSLYIAGNGEIVKSDKAGNELFRYSSQMLDEYSMLDCTQPLKILAFSEYSQQYVLLDQFMTETGGKRLIDLGVRYASAVCTARDGNIWVMDQISMTLVKLDPLRETELIKIPLEDIFPKKSKVLGLTEYQNKIFIHEKSKGLMMFDLYGNFLGLKADPPIDHFAANTEGFYLCRPSGLFFKSNRKDEEVMVFSYSPGPFAVIDDLIFYKRDGELLVRPLD